MILLQQRASEKSRHLWRRKTEGVLGTMERARILEFGERSYSLEGSKVLPPPLTTQPRQLFQDGKFLFSSFFF